MMANENYVFFRPYDGSAWPSGSLGPQGRHARHAGDRQGGLSQGMRPLRGHRGRRGLRFQASDQAIHARSGHGGRSRRTRVDIYMGEGPDAETLAGGQYAEGELFYFFLRR